MLLEIRLSWTQTDRAAVVQVIDEGNGLEGPRCATLHRIYEVTVYIFVADVRNLLQGRPLAWGSRIVVGTTHTNEQKTEAKRNRNR